MLTKYHLTLLTTGLFTAISWASPETELESVTVKGTAGAFGSQNKNFTMEEIDTGEFFNQAKDLSQVLNGLSGITIRSSGGLGQEYELSMNGLSGEQVRFYIDGVPMENYGPSMGINNFPVNLIERIDVYRGVVPISLAGDALGGAINFVTRKAQSDFTDIAYTIGSFNTHRLSLSSQFVSARDHYLITSAYLNYSDNDYEVDNIPVTDSLDNKIGEASFKRFNDTYHSQMLNMKLGSYGLNWADDANIGISLSENYDEVQNPSSTMNRAFGKLHSRSQTYLLSSHIERNLGQHDVRWDGQIGTSKDTIYDTFSRKYDWDGSFEDSSQGRAEFYEVPSILEIKDKIYSSTAFYQYTLSDDISLSTSLSTYGLERSGNDNLNPNNRFFSTPNSTVKNILAFNISTDIKNSITWDTFAKVYHFAADTTTSENNEQINTSSDFTNYGFGSALKWPFSQNSYGTVSIEKAYRLPTPDEVLGDGQFIRANPDLKPETSNNINLGIASTLETKNWFSSAGINLFYRDASDFIQYEADRIITGINVNKSEVEINGFEANLEASYSTLFKLAFTTTYQDIRDVARETILGGQNQNYNGRLPNKPYLFSRLQISTEQVLYNNVLSVSWNTQFVEKFYLTPESSGNSETKRVIPQQLFHDLDISYALAYGKYNVGLSVSNITDEKLYDNFSIQKPGRAFYLKLRYTY
ncbi:TonB-dependent receptor plug domain-containing protein [Bermanella marisrubri]|uniref:Putative TonB-dependent outer membrane receptor protein n=1 Tax=Bermanella marisrubri TaxID=207949 RepID=Q1N1B1_9GAMM|nr:TonB-dependent receptor [Bermanella marisrubri]EAT11940.1 putative TonB-dependent outer membrane receptor protein [Oceanobacter sp. RED65] [Bermanella marisrubri]QIZ84745.1 TonB-dependent receptor plug domain-containing protein [Bermanella marisrubri]